MPISACRSGLRDARRVPARSACCGSIRAMNQAGVAAARRCGQQTEAHGDGEAERVDFRLEADRQRAGDLARAQAPAFPTPPARCRRQSPPTPTSAPPARSGRRRAAARRPARGERRTPVDGRWRAPAEVRGVAADGDQHEQHQRLQQRRAPRRSCAAARGADS